MARKKLTGKALLRALRNDPNVEDPEALLGWIRSQKSSGWGKGDSSGKSSSSSSSSNGGDSGKGSGNSKEDKLKALKAKSGKLKRITAEEVDKEPWKYSAQQYQAAKGVDQPSIGEISATQFNRLGKQQRARYEKQRTKDWQKSADTKSEWREKVRREYEAGRISRETPGLSSAAREEMTRAAIDKRKAADKASKESADQANRITSLDQIEKGSRVHSTLYGPAQVARKSDKSVRLQLLDSEGKPKRDRDGKLSQITIPTKQLKSGALTFKKR